MPLFLIEIEPAETSREASQSVLDALTEAAGATGELIEAQIAADHSRIFSILESDGPRSASAAATEIGDLAASVQGPHQVRLVGAELEDVKALRRSVGYLVEWDIPAEITMEKYLARKKANSPKYAEVPETSFLRTYVLEDTSKCLCFYDAPDEDAVVRAREAVQTPIDRIWSLDAVSLGSTSA